MKDRAYDNNFPDSTEHTSYTVTIVSENGEELEIKHVDDHSIHEILDILT